MNVKKLPGAFLRFSRLIAGIVFVYSGFVKGIDPLGSVYKLGDYFAAFGIEFLEPFALPLSVILSTAELLIGVLLLTGVHMILASWAVLLFMGFFTILTFFIALTDPVADCGCFGDAIILTNWETFWKNVILMLLVIKLFIMRKRFRHYFTSKVYEWSALTVFLITILGITFYSYYNLPLIDYRPFSVGADIEQKMTVPPDAPADEYDVTLYYEKNEEIKAFSVDSLPDPSWEWVRTESTLISRGYEPPITNFQIESVDEGVDYTYDILQDEGYTFLLISWLLDESSGKNTERINRLAEWSYRHGINFICLTASPESQINDFRRRTGASYEFYHTDEITLKTVIRSNPGLVLMKQGTILGKWHYRKIPHTDELKENLLSYSLELKEKSNNTLVSTGFILAIVFAMVFMKAVRPYVNKSEEEEGTVPLKDSAEKI